MTELAITRPLDEAEVDNDFNPPATNQEKIQAAYRANRTAESSELMLSPSFEVVRVLETVKGDIAELRARLADLIGDKKARIQTSRDTTKQLISKHTEGISAANEQIAFHSQAIESLNDQQRAREKEVEERFSADIAAQKAMITAKELSLPTLEAAAASATAAA